MKKLSGLWPAIISDFNDEFKIHNVASDFQLGAVIIH